MQDKPHPDRGRRLPFGYPLRHHFPFSIVNTPERYLSMNGTCSIVHFGSIVN